MKSRLFRSLAASSLAAGMLLAVAVPHATAASDTDDSISPANTAVTGTATNFSAVGVINGITVTVHCTGSTLSGTTPASGLTVTIAPPTFTGCTDSLSGTDTVLTNSTNGAWKLTFLDAANDETKPEPNADKIKLTVPKGAATFMSSILPSCTVNVAPTAAASVTSKYDDKSKATLSKAKIPTNGTGCTTGATSSLSATYTLSPGIHDVS